MPRQGVYVPCEVGRELRVQVLATVRELLVIEEKRHELRTGVFHLADQLRSREILTEGNGVLAFEANRQLLHVRLFLVHGKLKDVPARFRGPNVPTRNITRDLVVSRTHDGRCAVRAFVHILVNVLDGLGRRPRLNVDMTLVLPKQERVVWHNPAVVTNDRSAGTPTYRHRK